MLRKFFEQIQFKKKKTFVISCSFSRVIPECTALAVGLGASKIVIERDCRGAVDLLISGEACLNKFGKLLADIASFAEDVEVIFNFVPPTSNCVAHRLARHVFVCTTSES